MTERNMIMGGSVTAGSFSVVVSTKFCISGVCTGFQTFGFKLYVNQYDVISNTWIKISND